MTVQNVNISLTSRLEWSLSSTADPCYSKFTIICKLAIFVSHHFTFFSLFCLVFSLILECLHVISIIVTVSLIMLLMLSTLII